MTSPPKARPLPPIYSFTLRFFRGIARRYFRRHFRAVLAQNAQLLTSVPGPLIVYGNHSSWWDPMLIVLLGHLLLPHRRHYAPIDAEALKQYPILRRLGIFPVEMATPRGAAQFLRTAEAILQSGGVLWLTPQGRFADPRERPLAFKPGLAALARRLPQVPLIPLAVEYTFWNERLPEALLRAGTPFHIDANQDTAALTQTLEATLAENMEALQAAALQRDESAFSALFTGARGTGGMYAWVRRVGALFTGRRLSQDHLRRHSQEPAPDQTSRPTL